MTDLEFAEELAKRAHGEQKYGNIPYWFHLYAVNCILENHGITNEYLRIAAWLHDVLEDTSLPSATLELLFGNLVERVVNAVTGLGRNRKERAKDIYHKIAEHPYALPIKLADRIANAEASAKITPASLECTRTNTLRSKKLCKRHLSRLKATLYWA